MLRSIKIFAVTVLLLACWGVTLTQAAPANTQASDTAPNVYVLELTVGRDGKQLATPKMTVLFGKPARINLINRNTPEGNLCIQVLANPGTKTSKGVATVQLQAVVLEHIAGAWVVIAEPSIKAVEGQPASMQLNSGAGTIQLSFKAVPTFSAKVAAATPSTCPALDAPIATQSTGIPCDSLPCPGGGDKNCCSAACSDDSGRTMTCCGAIECCDGVCGACCSPPGN